MKKVIIISPAYPLRGGIAESTELLYREYIKKGVSCKIISYKLQYPNFFFPGKSQVINLNKKKEGLNILSKLNSINPISWFFVARFISMQNPDYVIFRYWNPFFAPCLGMVSFLIKNKKIKKIGWVDNIFPHKRVPFQNILNNFFLKKMNGFIVMSQSVKKHFRQFSCLWHGRLAPPNALEIWDWPCSWSFKAQKTNENHQFQWNPKCTF